VVSQDDGGESFVFLAFLVGFSYIMGQIVVRHWLRLIFSAYLTNGRLAVKGNLEAVLEYCKYQHPMIEIDHLRVSGGAACRLLRMLMNYQREKTDLFKVKREKMVASQLAGRGIKDRRVLAVMGEIPRQLFVEEALAEQAYNDSPLPIGENQTISQPYMVALMSEALQLTGKEKVLEIGTGSGYQTAVLAFLGERVFSIERIAILAARARKSLDALGIYNVAIRVGDGTYGWPEEAPFDAIIVTAGAPAVPQNLVRQLAIGGYLVIPTGSRQEQSLLRITRLEEDITVVRQENLGGCRFVDLIGEQGWRPE
jgi:protein-L-isoaspartate(D-aspartate) O-methyltransferase